MSAFPAARPVDATELQRVTDGNVRNLPNRYETNAQVLGALLGNQLLGRELRYDQTLPSVYRSIGGAEIDTAARDYLQPGNMVIVVVGDRAVIDPQLESLGMEIEYLDASSL